MELLPAFIDLHLHLDGSLPLKTLIHLAQKQHIALPAYEEEALRAWVSVSADCADLNEYLRCFTLPLQLLQTREALTEAVYALLEELEKQQVCYAEIRFAPQLHQKQGLTQAQVVQAALQGLKAGTQAFSVQAQLILCCMRSADTPEQNEETIQVAAQFLGQGVCAADLAGAEALYPTANFTTLFQKAQNLGVPFTIHAGEAAGPESIEAALQMGAQRIGHGIRCLESEKVTQLLYQKQIPLEVCPQSNLDTKAIPGGLSAYPIRELLEKGLNLTINTDNMTVSHTTLAQEFTLLEQNFSVTLTQEIQLLKNAAFAAFLPQAEKERLWQRIARQIASQNPSAAKYIDF